MSAFLSPQVQALTPSSLAGLAGRPSPFLRRGSIPPLRSRGQFGGLVAVKAGLEPPFSFGDEASVGGVGKEVWERVEGMLYSVADAAVSSDAAGAASKQSGDWLSGITDGMETVLKILKGGLSAMHVPYSYGFAIILLTVIVKAVTFPLSKKQVESAMAMRSLQPQIQAIQKRYAGDQEKIQIETARLYKLAGVNPLAGCLPTLATIPVWIGLYRALSNVANEGLLTEGFFWIPSLSGPTTIAAKQNGTGISWLFPFVDGHPPLGWSDTFAYLVLPLLLVVSQYISVQIMQSVQSTDPNQKSSQAFTKFLPLMIGYFSLSVPSGLSLYWLTNNILSTAQQIWLQQFGGAKVPNLQSKETLHKEPPPQKVQKIPDNLTRVDYKVKETTLSEGPRPGERFKRIKEQEAKRRREREEKKREEASRQLVIGKEGKKQENLSTTITNEVERGAVVNGVTSSQEAVEQAQSLSSKSTNDDTSATKDVETDVNYSSQRLHEEKSVETHTSEVENGSMESASYSRSNEPNEKNGL